MPRNRKSVRTIRKLYKNICASIVKLRKLLLCLLQTFLVTKRKPKSANAGFVLPTVAMVSLVVVLLTIAILFRSFERSKNASNVRVNEATLNAAAPAIERAGAKIKQLFQDPRLPRSTPSDLSLSQVIDTNISEFTFGDETPLKLKITNELKTDLQINSTLQADDTEANTAWKYPVDTDNNGKFDSYTLYGIYYRIPRNATRSRTPLEARSQPMDEGLSQSQCPSEIVTSANLVGAQGWFRASGKLKRSLFVYTTTLPITDKTLAGVPSSKRGDYEAYKGNKGFAALEYQQDRERIPINNNAVLYEDDLEIAPGAGINLNGRIFTNGNLLTRQPFDPVRFYLVSSDQSCYYAEENSKIVVAGNLINSRINEGSGSGDVRVDLFTKPYSDSKEFISDTNKSVPQSVYGNQAAYNDVAYAQRIDRLVKATTALYPNQSDISKLPKEEVQDEIKRDMIADKTLTYQKALDERLRVYFRRRTRRVPYAEVPVGGDALKQYATTSPLLDSNNPKAIRPINEWVFPFNPNDTTNATGYAGIGVKDNGTDKLYLSATDPEVQIDAGKEEKIGDRILVGNNMPQYWFDTTKSDFVSSPDEGQEIKGKKWDAGSNKPRKRFSQAYQLDNLGVTNRDDFWEQSAAAKPDGVLDIVGGMRVVTGAGIYLPNTFTKGGGAGQFAGVPTPPTPVPVWADSMPMGVTTQAQGLPTATTPYLRMRATVVYHYQSDTYDPQKPTDYQAPSACISSYYDPTNSTTSRNEVNLPDIDFRDPKVSTSYRNPATALPVTTAANAGQSNNGVVYSATSLSISGYEQVLNYQAQLKYPNGNWVNEQLRKAMDKRTAGGNLTLAEQSAIDSSVCALKIFDNTIGSPTQSIVPHGAIYETAFLDARQVKAIDKVSSSTPTYDLDVEQRQPLEIRATVLDLHLLRKKAMGADFLVPNSGIIYAAREDAISDKSNSSETVSATDFRLDPNRRPNGILLINGSDLSRNSTYKPEEKGLILASDLAVYIQGEQTNSGVNEGYFNRHTNEEFSDILLKTEKDWSNKFYARKTPNQNFACRSGQFSACNTGESWRPASVIADSITILSHNFRFGFRNEGDYGLRDNYGNYPVGYNFDGVGGINPATLVTLDETFLRIDLNADGDMADKIINTWDETKLKVDINGNQTIDSTPIPISESNITATVAERLNGFWDNNFVTSFPWQDNVSAGGSSGYGFPADLSPTPALIKSSYFNNFVTPIQRRVPFAEYVMEICRRPTVAACTPGDWVVGYDQNGDGDFDDAGDDANLKARDLKPDDASYTVKQLGAGTTARPALIAADRAFPRRIAFLRDASDRLEITGSGTTARPIPLGIRGVNNPTPNSLDDNNGRIYYYPYAARSIGSNSYPAYSSIDKPRTHRTALWFKTVNGSSADFSFDHPLFIDNPDIIANANAKDQPLLVPVLQIHFPFTTSINPATLSDSQNIRNDNSNWLQSAVQTETNLVFAHGDTPARPTESNGGLENFVRYLERWEGVRHIAAGAFIQFKRSSYATAPWQVFTTGHNTASTGYTTSASGTSFGYPQGYRTAVTNVGNLGRTPFYVPPLRFWGYDVALLTQLPDLFSQRFTTPSTAEPNEFFREVGRDDAWVKTLLCAAEDNTKTGAGYDDASDVASGFKYAVSKDQRPNACQ